IAGGVLVAAQIRLRRDWVGLDGKTARPSAAGWVAGDSDRHTEHDRRASKLDAVSGTDSRDDRRYTRRVGHKSRLTETQHTLNAPCRDCSARGRKPTLPSGLLAFGMRNSQDMWIGASRALLITTT